MVEGRRKTIVTKVQKQPPLPPQPLSSTNVHQNNLDSQIYGERRR